MKRSNKDLEILAMEAYDPSQDEYKEMIDTINSLAKDLTELQDTLSVYQMIELNQEQCEASKTIKDLRERIRVNEIVIDSLTVGRDMYMTRVYEATRSANYWQKRCKKLEKQFGVINEQTNN